MQQKNARTKVCILTKECTKINAKLNNIQNAMEGVLEMIYQNDVEATHQRTPRVVGA